MYVKEYEKYQLPSTLWWWWSRYLPPPRRLCGGGRCRWRLHHRRCGMDTCAKRGIITATKGVALRYESLPLLVDWQPLLMKWFWKIAIRFPAGHCSGRALKRNAARLLIMWRWYWWWTLYCQAPVSLPPSLLWAWNIISTSAGGQQVVGWLLLLLAGCFCCCWFFLRPVYDAGQAL